MNLPHRVYTKCSIYTPLPLHRSRECWREINIMKTIKKVKKNHRIADDITAGMKQLQEMIKNGKTHEEMQFTVRTIQVPEPRAYSAGDVSKLRESLGVSQAIFARLVGVSKILVQSWEGGQRTPAPVARRLMDTISANPGRWLETIRQQCAA
jgi:DNA-binding transcriptional regulator YiaG